MTNFIKEDMVRFETRYTKQPDGCWDFTGGIIPDGYGNFPTKDGNIRAHRFSYMIYKGEIEEGKVIMHTCDNRKCVNPEHLKQGTQQENVLDCSMKNRMNTSHGEAHCLSKMDNEKVKEIRSKESSGVLQKTLAVEYGVCIASIHNIVKRKTWKHI